MESPGKPIFVGRDPILQRLHNAFEDHNLVVIAGRSGIGKTAVLWEYTQQFAQQHQAIVWFNAINEETFLADLIAALQMYSLPIDITQGADHLFQILRDYLREQQNPLLILENFSYNLIIQGLADERRADFYVIISTHAPQTPEEVLRLEVKALDAREGALVLLRQAGVLSSEQGLHQAEEDLQQAALALSREVRGLPITLDLIGRYLRLSSRGVQEYLDTFRSYPTPRHLSASMDPSAMEEFAIACECSLTYVKETSREAFEFLQMIALHSAEAIPAALFQSPAELEDHDEALELSNSQLLFAAGLVSVDQDPTLWTMHRLIQDIVLQTLTEEEKQQRIKRLLQLWQKHLPALKSESLSRRLQMASQVRHLSISSESVSAFFDELRSSHEAADVFAWAASLYWEQHLVSMAEPLLRRAFTIWQHTLGNTHPMVATILTNLAIMNQALKNYGDAELFGHQAVVSKSTALGINHPDVLFALDLLGHIYVEQGKLPEARQCYEKALTIAEKVELTHDPMYNVVRYDLALLHIQQKNWGRAEELLRRVSIGRVSMLGAEDPATIEAFSRLAEVCVRQKNWQTAQIAYKRILPSCEKLLGGEHPTVLHHLEQEAGVWLHLNEIEMAKKQLQRVQEVKERTLGKEHPGLIPCLNGLAQVALAEQEYASGLALLTRARQIYAHQPEPDPLLQAALFDTTASIELALQHFEQATSLYKQVLNIYTRIVGEKQPELIDPLEHLARAYSVQQEYQQAQRYLLQALVIYQETGRPEDILLDPVLNSLAEIEIVRGQLTQARNYLERSRAIRELALGKNDARTLAMVQKLTSISNTHIS